MAIEMEAKMQVRSFDSVRSRLSEVGAQRQGSVLETNILLDMPDKKLLEQGKGLRVRRAANQEGAGEEQIITFKGPRHPGELKTREELELKIEEGDAVQLLRSIGFIPMISFQKRRETWRTAQCSIELDELPHLGKFIEIEGPDEKTILSLRESLGLAAEPLVRSGYVELMVTYLETHNIRQREVQFQNQ